MRVSEVETYEESIVRASEVGNYEEPTGHPNLWNMRTVMMDNGVIPQTMAEVNDQVAMLKGRGVETPVEVVLRETIKRGLQEMFDEKLDGNYYSIEWVDEKFDVFSLGHEFEGSVEPNGETFAQDFEKNAATTWDYLDDQAQKLVGR